MCVPCVVKVGSVNMGTLSVSPSGSIEQGSGGHSGQQSAQHLYTSRDGSGGKMRSLTSMEAYNILRVSMD